MTFSLLLWDRREASELTSLSRTGLGKLNRLARTFGLLIPAGLTCRRGEKSQDISLKPSLEDFWPSFKHCHRFQLLLLFSPLYEPCRWEQSKLDFFSLLVEESCVLLGQEPSFCKNQTRQRNLTDRNQQFTNGSSFFFFKATGTERRPEECVMSEEDVLINTNWKQLCLIRLNHFHPPGC